MLGYYDEFTNLSYIQRRTIEKAEKAALYNADLLVYSSDWAASSAIGDYGVPQNRVTVIPSGANIGADNELSQIGHWIEERCARPLELLFVGKDWSRKRGALCVETVRLLNERGIHSRLHVVGCRPSLPVECAPYVTVHGPLISSIADNRRMLEGLFRRAHFLFTPSRAEAYGMVFCEASAFGLPCITTATGGICTVVRSGINGVTLPVGEGAAQYAREIAALFANQEAYRSLALSSFAEFENRLNWRTWMQRFLGEVEVLISPYRRRSMHAAGFGQRLIS